MPSDLLVSRSHFALRFPLSLIAITAIAIIGIVPEGASAASVKVGQICTRVGAKTGSLVCAKVNRKQVWKSAVTSQTISVVAPQSVLLTSGQTQISYSATSKLKVRAVAITSGVCRLDKNAVVLLQAGQCIIRLTQSGSAQYLAAPAKEIQFWVVGDNEISFSLPQSVILASGGVALVATASSMLIVEFQSTTPDICRVTNNLIVPLTGGRCTVRASQSGSAAYSQANPVDVSMNIQAPNRLALSVATSILLSQQTYTLVGTALSSLPIVFNSTSLDTCTVSGTTLTLLKIGVCTVRGSQAASDYFEAAQAVDASIQISAERVSADQPDTISGFQVKVIYVVPSDGSDHNYDTSGYISSILDEGNSYLNSQIGLTLPIDHVGKGYDIQFLKSTLTTSSLRSSTGHVEELLSESEVLENPGSNRKNYIFFIDVPILKDGACGYAKISSITAVVAIGKSAGSVSAPCDGGFRNFVNQLSLVWLHEVFHSLGVNHSPDDPCDMMSGSPETTGTCPAGANLVIDKDRNRYVGGESQGVNLLKLRVWNGYTNRPDLRADCVLNPTPRADGFNYAYCPTGTQIIGALKNCYFSIRSISLQEFVNGTWVDLGSGSHYITPWGPRPIWSCVAGFSAPWKSLTIEKPGISLYRWMINGSESEQFKVIWVQ